MIVVYFVLENLCIFPNVVPISTGCRVMRLHGGHLGGVCRAWPGLYWSEPELPMAVWQVGEKLDRPGGLGVNMLCCQRCKNY